MNDTPDLTPDELAALGYLFESYSIDVKHADGYTDIYTRYRVTAPDGQLIAEDCTTATDAWDWARFHERRTR